MLFIEKVEVKGGERILETYGDLLFTPRIRYRQGDTVEVTVTVRDETISPEGAIWYGGVRRRESEEGK